MTSLLTGLKLFILLICYSTLSVYGQMEVIPVLNSSFEGIPAAGTTQSSFDLMGWHDCASQYFKGQTPPDIQSGYIETFEVKTIPYHGQTYVGLVTRENETWEMIGQELNKPIESGKCYSFSIHLAKSDVYLSNFPKYGQQKIQFTEPVVLRIFGAFDKCSKMELLAETPIVTKNEWELYTLFFEPKNDYSFIILEAFYKTPCILPYNGNLLLDATSDIVRIACPNEPQMEMAFKSHVRVKDSANQQSSIKNTSSTNANPNSTEITMVVEEKSVQIVDDALEPKVISSIFSETVIERGAIIQMKDLFFTADSTSILEESLPVLENVYRFMMQNPGITIEIGGHTNGIPGSKYCYSLSLERAKAVYQYLVERGISADRLTYKGYGKDYPIASDMTPQGRRLNQRVELTILSLNR